MSGTNRDPMGKPEGPTPWHELDPEIALDPWRDADAKKVPELPVTLGPASRSGSPAPNPFCVAPPGLDPQASLAERLHWDLPQRDE